MAEGALPGELMPGVAHAARQRVHAHVAGRGDDHDARAHGRFHGLHQRVGRRRLEDGMAERQVDDVDAVGGLVGHGPLNRVDHVARRADAVVVEHAQAHIRDARRHALGFGLVAADEAGHVRAVAVAIERRDGRGIGVAGREVARRLDAAVPPPSCSSPESITATVTPAPVRAVVGAARRVQAAAWPRRCRHGLLAPSVQPAVTVPPPGRVAAAPRTLALAVPVPCIPEARARSAIGVKDLASPLAATAPSTTSPAALASETAGALLVPAPVPTRE